jgi:hypothetical protein
MTLSLWGCWNGLFDNSQSSLLPRIDGCLREVGSGLPFVVLSRIVLPVNEVRRFPVFDSFVEDLVNGVDILGPQACRESVGNSVGGFSKVFSYPGDVDSRMREGVLRKVQLYCIWASHFQNLEGSIVAQPEFVLLVLLSFEQNPVSGVEVGGRDAVRVRVPGLDELCVLDRIASCLLQLQKEVYKVLSVGDVAGISSSGPNRVPSVVEEERSLLSCSLHRVVICEFKRW